MLVRALANDFYGVLVSPNRAIRAQSIKHRSNCLRGFGREIGVVLQAGVRHIIMYANSEVVLWDKPAKFIKDRLGHSRREFLGGETITSTDDPQESALIRTVR